MTPIICGIVAVLALAGCWRTGGFKPGQPNQRAVAPWRPTRIDLTNLRPIRPPTRPYDWDSDPNYSGSSRPQGGDHD